MKRRHTVSALTAVLSFPFLHILNRYAKGHPTAVHYTGLLFHSPETMHPSNLIGTRQCRNTCRMPGHNVNTEE